MNIKGFRRMLLGEKMPDRNDPKYKERYERVKQKYALIIVLYPLNGLQHGAGIDIGKRIDLFVDLRTWFAVQFNGHYCFAALFLPGKTEITDIDAFFCHNLCNSGNRAGGIFVKNNKSCILSGKGNFHPVYFCYQDISSSDAGTKERYLAALCIG